MQVPQNLPYDLQQDDGIEIRQYPVLWMAVVLSPLCAFFWIALIRGLIAVFGG